MSVSLPKGETNKGKANWSDVYGNDKALKEAAETLEGKFPVAAANLAAAAKPVAWYEPKIIATEESRTNTAFGTLTTADEIKEVVLPTNGVIRIGYVALVKSSVSGAGRVAIFLGSNQLKTASEGAPAVQESATLETTFMQFGSTTGGMSNQNASPGASSFVTTGQVLGAGGGGMAEVFAAAGTYSISVRFKASSGSITAKERKLWVEVLGT